MKKVWTKNDGFGEVVGRYRYAGIWFLRIRWDRSPWFVDDVPETEVETCGK